MSPPPEHSKKRISAYLEHLERCNAPKELIEDFLELIDMSNNMAKAAHLGYDLKPYELDSLDLILLESCRNFNFPSPFNSSEGAAYFPPSDLMGHSGYRKDGRLYDENFNPEVEQAYRRGFCQGFEDALDVGRVSKTGTVAKRRKDLWNWRRSLVWFKASEPGTQEPFGINLGIRKSISKRLRWTVLDRDGNKCVACGVRPADGIRLHVDHILSIYHGGTNDLSNLQTLCEHCNLGKGKD